MALGNSGQSYGAVEFVWVIFIRQFSELNTNS